MKRLSIYFVVALILGILMGVLIDNYYICVFIEIELFLLLVLNTRGKEYINYIFIILIFFIYGSISTIYVNKKEVFREFDNRNVYIAGYINSEVQEKDEKISFQVIAKNITYKKITKNINEKIIITTDNKNRKENYYFGRKINVYCKIRNPKENTNFKGFNYKRYLLGNKIRGFAFTPSYNIELNEKVYSNIFLELGMDLKRYIIDTIEDLIPERQAAVLEGMLIGYTQNSEEDIENTFRNAGITHILVVSGANIGFILVFCKYILRNILKIKVLYSNMMMMCVLLIYLFIVGFQPSIIRAIVMAAVVLTGEVIFRRADTLSSIAVAAIVLLMSNPFTLYDLGFQLSFLATISIIMFNERVKRKLKEFGIADNIASNIALTTVAQVGILPVEIYNFNKISVYSILANLVIIPVHAIVVILGFAMVILEKISTRLGKIVGVFENLMLKFIIFSSEKITKIPYSSITFITPGIIIVICYYIIIYVEMYKHNLRTSLKKRIYLTILVVFIGSCLFNMNISQNIKVHFIDVAQGDSILIRSMYNKNILIDGGGENSKILRDRKIGEKVVVPVLLKNKIKTIDIMIATHGHGDHIDGLIDVIKNLEVKKIIIPDTECLGDLGELLQVAEQENIEVIRFSRGDNIRIDKYTNIDFLNPSQKSNLDGENSNSLVAKLTYKNVSILFTGDITKDTEVDLIKNKIDFKVDVLKVAHHGSIYSTSTEFLEQSNPKIAIISVGENNTFDHPSEVVIQRILNKNIKIFRTDKNGEIILKTNGKKIKIRTKII